MTKTQLSGGYCRLHVNFFESHTGCYKFVMRIPGIGTKIRCFSNDLHEPAGNRGSGRGMFGSSFGDVMFGPTASAFCYTGLANNGLVVIVRMTRLKFTFGAFTDSPGDNARCPPMERAWLLGVPFCYRPIQLIASVESTNMMT